MTNPSHDTRESRAPGQALVRAGAAQAVSSLRSGESWEECVDGVVADVAPVASPDLLLVFVDAAFQRHYEAIIAALRERTGAAHLIGASGQSVIGAGVEAEDSSGIAALAATLPGVDLRPLAIVPQETGPEAFDALARADTDVWLLFADPYSVSTDNLVGGLQKRYPQLVLMGGMASARNESTGTAVFLDDRVLERGAAMLGLRGARVRNVVAQGAEPLGQPWIITECEANQVQTLGSRPALEVLIETLEALDEPTRARAEQNLLVGLAMNEYQDEHGRGDYLIRNLVGADRESGVIAINEFPRVGQTFQFQIRDAAAADEDLREQLRTMRGALDPGEVVLGALLCSCNGRGRGLFGAPHHDAQALADAFGPLPTAGFFCSGEIGPVGGINFLHGFTASIALLTAAAT